MFVSSIGHTLWSLLRELLAPEAVKYVSFDTIATKHKDHFESRTNVIVERYNIHSIKQSEFQPSRDFLMELRKQAIRWNFGESKDDTIRDQVVIGVFNKGTRKRLLAIAKLTLQQAIDTLQVEEQVERHAKHSIANLILLEIVLR